MHENILFFSIFLIFTGAAIFSTVALYTRQSLLVAYMILGVALGPWGLGWVTNAVLIQNIGDVGIVFLLFLLGLHLHPQSLLHLLKKVSWVALVSSVIFLLLGLAVGWLFHYTWMESVIIGACAMFSSTIIGLKLLPTTVLHHQHTGEVMIGILLLQDLIAILTLLFVHSASLGNVSWIMMSLKFLQLPFLIVFAFIFERFVLRKLFRRFDRIREYMFLLAIAWCLSLAQLANMMGLSAEIGAFTAGVSIATSPIAVYIAESLKPVRDFFLVLFFFAIGASFNVGYFHQVAIPALLLAVLLLLAKPWVFRILLMQVGESKSVAGEIGVRLGQISEFSILLVYISVQESLISQAASSLVQLVTMLTFIVSSYLVVLRYPTPVAISDRLRRD
ncbi:MAG TPA: cation:proton antiporter [Gammaproteobacteria bacterium]|nr:cation:proton antiporter [Gammaproteobacteria bacterium]